MPFRLACLRRLGAPGVDERTVKNSSPGALALGFSLCSGAYAKMSMNSKTIRSILSGSCKKRIFVQRFHQVFFLCGDVSSWSLALTRRPVWPTYSAFPVSPKYTYTAPSPVSPSLPCDSKTPRVFSPAHVSNHCFDKVAALPNDLRRASGMLTCQSVMGLWIERNPGIFQRWPDPWPATRPSPPRRRGRVRGGRTWLRPGAVG